MNSALALMTLLASAPSYPLGRPRKIRDLKKHRANPAKKKARKQSQSSRRKNR